MLAHSRARPGLRRGVSHQAEWPQNGELAAPPPPGLLEFDLGLNHRFANGHRIFFVLSIVSFLHRHQIETAVFAPIFG